MAEALTDSTTRYPHRIIMTWKQRVQYFYKALTLDARPTTLLRKMVPELNLNDPIIEMIMSLDRDNNSINATEKLVDYLLSEDGMDAGRIAERWRVFGRALEEVNPLLYDIVTGKYDPDVQDRQRNLINTYMDDICSSVDPIRLLPDLISQHLLGEMERENLQSITDNKGSTMGACYMISQLHRSGIRDWLKAFLDVLKKNGYSELAVHISGAYKGAFKASSASSLPPSTTAFREAAAEGILARSDSETRPKERVQLCATSLNSNKQQCPTCRQMFTILARHKCKMAESEASRDVRGSINGERPGDKECGKMACPNGPGHTSQATNGVERTTDTQSYPAAKGGARPKDTQQQPARNATKPQEQQCLGCGRWFKQISRHVCKADGAAPTTSFQTAQKAQPQEEKCPGCGMMFKQISRHVCKAAATTTATTTTTSSETRAATASGGARPKASPAQPAATPAKPEEKCPTCGKMFKRLYSHKCKAPGAATSTRPIPNGPTASSKTQSTQRPSAGATNEEQPCPKCGKIFKQLSRHKCKF